MKDLFIFHHFKVSEKLFINDAADLELKQFPGIILAYSNNERTLRFASNQVSMNSFERGEVIMSYLIRGQSRHLVFPIGPKNTNLVEDVEILLPVKFC